LENDYGLHIKNPINLFSKQSLTINKNRIFFSRGAHLHSRFGFMVFKNSTFNNISVISWQSVLLVEETGGHGETTNLSKVTDKRVHLATWP
jgi:hypothetical protein